jgi:DNA-binding CsgD family transcriptional regulator/PAS domain-containing protein
MEQVLPPGTVPEVADIAYDAATGGASWNEVGLALKQAIGARTATLWTGDPAEGRVEILYAENIPAAANQAYTARFHRLDPWVKRCAAIAASMPAGALPPAMLGQQIIADDELCRSEFYQEFARDLGLHHIVCTVTPLGEAGIMPLGLQRPEDAPPFGEAERQVVDALLPHFRRALRLRHRLQQAAFRPATGDALDILPMPALVVSADLRVTYANSAAEALAAASKGLQLIRTGPPPSSVLLAAMHNAEAAVLARLVREVALRISPGGGLRLTAPGKSGKPGRGGIALLAMPLPARLATPAQDAPVPLTGQVLLMARDLSQLSRPRPDLLADLFGLTKAEAEVAAALAGGVTAEAVAALRGVELPTIRSQVRMVLEKTGATSLRDLERILAALANH